jgi:hypothetical protein
MDHKELDEQMIKSGVGMNKALDSINTADAKKTTSDIQVHGDPDVWVLICKASSKSQGWMKSTKAMVVPGGCLVQVSTEVRNQDGTVSVAEAIAYAPGMDVGHLL